MNLRSSVVAAVACAVAIAVPAAADADTPLDRSNRGLVEMITDGADGIGPRIGQDLANVLDDGATRRVLTVVGKGAMQNLVDLRALRGVDLAIVQLDVLEQARRQGQFEGNLLYVAKLHTEEFHLLAGPAIKSIEDLEGKTVNIGAAAGGTAVTAPAVFARLKIKTETTSFDLTTALAKVRTGEIAALAFVAAKPAAIFTSLRGADGLHLLAIPLNAEILATYAPTRLMPEDYPELVDGPTDTIAVGSVLLAANLTPDSERYRNVAQFVDAFFTQFPKLLEPSRHPKWHEVNLAAELPGGRRLPAAELWLKRNAGPAAVSPNEQQLRDIFARFLDERSRLSTGKPMSPPEKDLLFQQFRNWQQSSQAR
jgi:TRAP-type uncharacterized transport system substrate-binding protein